jgi:hypothetical protein
MRRLAMFAKRVLSVIITMVLFLIVSRPPLAMEGTGDETVLVPVGTKVYCELQQRVVSKKKKNTEGSPVEARVFREVVVDGRIVIPRGTSVQAKVDRVKSAKVAGVGGKLEISANSITLVDGRKISMDGGLGKKGSGSVGATVALSLLVAWPLIFVPGGKAVLEPGTVFDAYTNESFEVTGGALRSGDAMASATGNHPTLYVRVLYDEMDEKKKNKAIPMIATLCGADLPSTLVIDRINGSEAKKPIPLNVKSHETIETCHECELSVPMKRLTKQFRAGINYFDVAYLDGGWRVDQEVIFDVQF